ncbi:PREDICTED: calpain-7 [Cyprinodon variegatus]|uniref:calpain-7 n=1 Tax=Cyprinodon variegatus TaxID=28743 RepID=UPI00074267B1|nr:PREDICTED: calpain-7 [Cyprinodon variegatus]
MDCTALEHDAFKFAKAAVTYDQKAKYNEAVFYYKEAAQALIYAGMAGSKLEGLQDKVNEYLNRVQALHNAVQSEKIDPLKSRHQVDLERAHFLVTQAFEEDEKGNGDEAIELYTQAVELCIKTSNESSDQTLQTKLKQLARQALDRAEGLKESQSKSTSAQSQDRTGPPGTKSSGGSSGPVRQFFPLGPDFSVHDRPQPQPIRAVQSSEPQGQRYTAEEIEVLRSTSTINGIAYVPFMSVDLKERFAFPVPFSDKTGKLALSPKQKAIFSRWVRPDEICNNPTMIMSVSSFSIKQTVVSDCSFVASLAISAAYERRYNKKLITSIIYPQNRRGEPEYNPCGKYMVKLHINGVPRKVTIENQLTGMRFLQLKNPWSHLRWKGRYSERDEKNWTPELLKYLNFDPKTAQKFDNGVFWIAWEDLCQYYDVIYLSWNPTLFKESSCIHSSWDGKQGPVKDVYSLANNPQYKLEAQCPAGGAAVWVLLTRHITDKDDFAQNREFITLVVYKTDGKKVYYPADPPPFIDGIRINSPHYLTKIRLTSPGTHTFTLVVSQYEKQNTINYTLRVYSGCKFTFAKIPNPFTHTKRINGQWKGISAGGCGNYKDSYKHNPIYQINLERAGPLLVELRGSRQYSVGFEMVTVSTVGDPGPASFQKKNSGDYRCGFCYMELDYVPAGIYNVTPTTFLPKQEGPFFLDFGSTSPLKVSQLQ